MVVAAHIAHSCLPFSYFASLPEKTAVFNVNNLINSTKPALFKQQPGDLSTTERSVFSLLRV